MDEVSQDRSDLRAERLSSLNVDGARPVSKPGTRHTAFVRSLRFILPLLALVMTVVVITWEDASHVEPMKKEELLPSSDNIQNELLKPVFNSVDSKQQPFSVTANRAVQNRENSDLVELEKPVANLTMTDGGVVNADANNGLYEQKSQKLNLSGDVHLKHSNGYVLSTEELRVDVAAQKAFSGRDVNIDGPDGKLVATGLEGDATTGALVFTGPAKVTLYSDGNLFSPKETTP